MCDLSTAFGVIDHPILVHRSDHTLVITGAALSWIKYRSMRIAITNVASDKMATTICMSQGSVLGPKLYRIFTKPKVEICRRHNMIYCYADDTQVYIVIKPVDK